MVTGAPRVHSTHCSRVHGECMAWACLGAVGLIATEEEGARERRSSNNEPRRD